MWLSRYNIIEFCQEILLHNMKDKSHNVKLKLSARLPLMNIHIFSTPLHAINGIY